MQYDRFDVDVRNVDWLETDDEPVQPVLEVTYTAFHGWRSDVANQLAGGDTESLSADEIDVAFRFQSATDDADATGVVSVANRATGTFILEASTPAALIQRLVEAARRYAKITESDRWYGIRLETDHRLITAYEKQVFLAYAEDGTLLRHRSLIPNGVEI